MLEYSEQAYRRENGIEFEPSESVEKIENEIEANNEEIRSNRSIRTISESVQELETNSIRSAEPQLIPVS